MAFPVAILGDINWDLVLVVEKLPARGQEVQAQKSFFRLGGSAANTARWLSRLGFEARLLVAVGEDTLGDLALQKLVQDGIPLHFIQRHPETTGLCLALGDGGGERTLLTSRGANACLSPPLPERWLEGAKWLHLSGYALLEPSSRAALRAALRWARDSAIPVSLDPGMVAVHGHTRFLRELGAVDVFLPNREEALALVGGLSPAELAELKGFGRRGFLKLGAEGSWAWDGEREVRVPAISVEVQDPVGAGDAFNAGVIAASILDGGLLAQAGLGNALGALAAAGIPFSPQALLRFVSKLPVEVQAELHGVLDKLPLYNGRRVE